MACELVCGDVGAGKTIWMVKKALWYMSRGHDVYCNFIIRGLTARQKPRFHHFIEPDEIVQLKKGVVFLDELPIYWDRTHWRELPIEFKTKLREHRKDSVTLYFSAQYIEDVPSFVFRFITRYHEIVPIVAGRLVLQKTIPKHQANKVKRRTTTKFVFLSKKLWSMYDTFYKVSGDLKKNDGMCQLCGAPLAFWVEVKEECLRREISEPEIKAAFLHFLKSSGGKDVDKLLDFNSPLV